MRWVGSIFDFVAYPMDPKRYHLNKDIQMAGRGSTYAVDSSDHGYETVKETTDVRAMEMPSSPPKSLSRTTSEASMGDKGKRTFLPEESELESLNLEDTESVMWRKVFMCRDMSCLLLLMCLRCYLSTA